MSMEIDAINFTQQGLAITYLDSGDIRDRVIVAHQISLHASHPDYREDIARIAELTEKVVRNALEDWAATPADPEERDDEDDDRGMGE